MDVFSSPKHSETVIWQQVSNLEGRVDAGSVDGCMYDMEA